MIDILVLIWLIGAIVLFMVLGWMMSEDRQFGLGNMFVLLVLCLLWPTGIVWIYYAEAIGDDDED